MNIKIEKVTKEKFNRCSEIWNIEKSKILVDKFFNELCEENYKKNYK